METEMAKDKNSLSPISSGRVLGVLCGICLLPIFFLFAHFGQPARGLAAMCALGVLISVLYVKRSFLKKTSFIAIMSLLFVIHFVFVMLFPFPTYHFPGILALPVSIVDLPLVLALVRLVSSTD
jgi:hypothetical protein